VASIRPDATANPPNPWPASTMEHPQPAAGVLGFQSTLSLFAVVPPSGVTAPPLLLPLLLPVLLLPVLLLLPLPLLLDPLLLPLELPLELPPLELPLLDPLLLPLELPLLDPLLLPLELPLLLLLVPPISAPLGVPQPVGPSNPTPAVQKDEVEHVPLLPEVTS
jgi:hypothetical protein